MDDPVDLTFDNIYDAFDIPLDSFFWISEIEKEIKQENDVPLGSEPLNRITFVESPTECNTYLENDNSLSPNSIELYSDSLSPENILEEVIEEVVEHPSLQPNDTIHLEIHNYSSPRLRPKSPLEKFNCVKKRSSEIKLTEEEKCLLSKEGYDDFPTDKNVLSKTEEKVLRKIRRKIRNKRSAQSSRLRKKLYLEELEKKFQDCCDENKGLKKEICSLKKENENLLMKMRRILSKESGQASYTTSLFVLFLSFLFVIFPFLRPEGIEDGISNLSDKDMVGTGRHLLMRLNDFESNGSEIVTNITESFSF